MESASSARRRAVRSRNDSASVNSTSIFAQAIEQAAQLFQPDRRGQVGGQRALGRAQTLPGRSQIAKHAAHFVHATVEPRAQNHQIADAFEQGVQALHIDAQEPLRRPRADRPRPGDPWCDGGRPLRVAPTPFRAVHWAWRGHGQASAAEQGPDFGNALVDAFQNAERRRELSTPDLRAQFFELVGRARHGVEAHRAGRALQRVQVAKQYIDHVRRDVEGGRRGARERFLRLADAARCFSASSRKRLRSISVSPAFHSGNAACSPLPLLLPLPSPLSDFPPWRKVPRPLSRPVSHPGRSRCSPAPRRAARSSWRAGARRARARAPGRPAARAKGG
jgi:hypothetical protein